MRSRSETSSVMSSELTSLRAHRESIGLHTCDRRSNKGEIAAMYPEFDFEVPFSYHVSCPFAQAPNAEPS